MAYSTEIRSRSETFTNNENYPGSAILLNNANSTHVFVDPERAKDGRDDDDDDDDDKYRTNKKKKSNAKQKKHFRDSDGQKSSKKMKIMKYLVAVLIVAIVFVAMKTSATISACLIASVLALSFAKYLSVWVLERDEGTLEMIEVAEAIREGSNGFMKTQYGLIGKLAVVCAACVFFYTNSGK